MRRPLRIIVAAALACTFVAGCSSNVGTLNIQVVTAPVPAGVDPDPFADISTIVVRVTAPGLVMESEKFGIKGRAGRLDAVPVGPDRQITVEGLGPDSDVLFRGRTAPLTIKAGTNNLQLYVGRVDRFSYIQKQDLIAARAFHTATLLDDDRVLLTGGVAAGQRWRPLGPGPLPGATASAEWIDTNGLLAHKTASMATTRLGHTATRTSRGNVLVAGGAATTTSAAPDAGPGQDAAVGMGGAASDGAADGPADSGATDASTTDLALTDGAADTSPPADKGIKDAAPATDQGPPPPLPGLLELYDPVNNKFSKSSQALYEPRYWHGAAATASEVLLIGGAGATSSPLSSVEHYSEGNLTRWIMHHARRSFATVTLRDGTVMVSGGLDQSGLPLQTTELWRPGSSSWIPGPPMSQPRAFHRATLLSDGKVLLLGGLSSTYGSGSATPTVERYDPQTNTITVLVGGTSYARAKRWAHAAVLLTDGQVLVTGGFFDTKTGQPSNSADLIRITGDVLDPGPIQAMNEPRAGHTATRLRSGVVLIAGGLTGGDVPSQTAEVYIY